MGIDLAAQPENTAVCRIVWAERIGVVDRLACGADDDQLLALMADADKVGIEFAFGWPDAFVWVIAGYHTTGKWPAGAPLPHTGAKQLQYRATDRLT